MKKVAKQFKNKNKEKQCACMRAWVDQSAAKKKSIEKVTKFFGFHAGN